MFVLFLTVFIDLVGFGIVIPLLPFYGEAFGARPETVTLLLASYSFSQFLFAPIWGALSDRYGRRPVLLITLLGAALGYVWLGLAETLPMMFAARLFGGAMAGNIGAAFAYAADITTPETRAKGMGVIGAAFGLGFIAGPAIGGVLAGAHPTEADFALPSFAAAGLSVLAFVFAVIFLRESLSKEARIRLRDQPRPHPWRALVEAVGVPGLSQPMLLLFLSTFVFAGMESTFALWSEREFGWGPRQNGYLFAYVGIVAAVVQGGLIGRLASRFGERRLIQVGGALLAAGLAFVPASHSVPLLVASMTLTAGGFALTMPSLNSMMSVVAGEEARGLVMGVGRSVSTMARVVGPAVAGWLFAWLGRDWPFLTGAAVMVVVIVLARGKTKAPGKSS